MLSQDAARAGRAEHANNPRTMAGQAKMRLRPRAVLVDIDFFSGGRIEVRSGKCNSAAVGESIGGSTQGVTVVHSTVTPCEFVAELLVGRNQHRTSGPPFAVLLLKHPENISFPRNGDIAFIVGSFEDRV